MQLSNQPCGSSATHKVGMGEKCDQCFLMSKKHHRMHSISKLEVDGLHKQNITSGSNSVLFFHITKTRHLKRNTVIIFIAAFSRAGYSIAIDSQRASIVHDAKAVCNVWSEGSNSILKFQWHVLYSGGSERLDYPVVSFWHIIFWEVPINTLKQPG